MKNNKFLSIHKILIAAGALLTLLASTILIDGIVILEPQYSGVVMFMYVLLSLVCLFNAVRTDNLKILTLVRNFIFLAITITFGVWLLVLYCQELPSDEATTVIIALSTLCAFIGAQVSGSVLLALSKITQ